MRGRVLSIAVAEMATSPKLQVAMESRYDMPWLRDATGKVEKRPPKGDEHPRAVKIG